MMGFAAARHLDFTQCPVEPELRALNAPARGRIALGQWAVSATH
jgi:hypothetical protein